MQINARYDRYMNRIIFYTRQEFGTRDVFSVPAQDAAILDSSGKPVEPTGRQADGAPLWEGLIQFQLSIP